MVNVMDKHYLACELSIVYTQKIMFFLHYKYKNVYNIRHWSFLSSSEMDLIYALKHKAQNIQQQINSTHKENT
jgi:hypothetical protein